MVNSYNVIQRCLEIKLFLGPLAVSKFACLFVFDHPETMMRMMPLLLMINIIVIAVTMIIFIRLNI